VIALRFASRFGGVGDGTFASVKIALEVTTEAGSWERAGPK